MSIEHITALTQRDPDLFTQPVELQATVLEWMNIHGHILVALRHPQNQGASRDLVLPFLTTLTELLLDLGVLEQSDLARMAEDEGIEFTVVQDQRIVIPGVLSCRKCGCTDERACPGGCSWAEIGEDGFGTCSRCA